MGLGREAWRLIGQTRDAIDCLNSLVAMKSIIHLARLDVQYGVSVFSAPMDRLTTVALVGA